MAILIAANWLSKLSSLCLYNSNILQCAQEILILVPK